MFITFDQCKAPSKLMSDKLIEFCLTNHIF